ncbi:MAG: hypothetical protein HFG66_14775 [Hungatella sp.]|nr:hypothetical protein [Hungatella sp.]
MGLLGKSNAPERGGEHKKQSFGRWREEKETELDVKLRRLSKKEKSKLSKPDFDKDFSEIRKKEEQQRRDRIIWKAYSNHGGIYDILADMEQFIEHPSANALDFDEEEGCYMIFITLSSTFLKRMNVLCDDMREQCRRGDKAEGQELLDVKERLEKRHRELEEQREAISGRCSVQAFQEERREILKILPRNRMELLLKDSGIRERRYEQKLTDFSKKLSRYERKLDEWIEAAETYNRQLEKFEEQCRLQKSYMPKYTALYELLEKLCRAVDAGGEYDILAVPPTGEEELDNYIKAAREFGRYIFNIMEEYRL